MWNGELRFLPYTDANSDPECFFLLFPCGEMGWDGSWEPKKAKTEHPQKIAAVPAHSPKEMEIEKKKEIEMDFEEDDEFACTRTPLDTRMGRERGEVEEEEEENGMEEMEGGEKETDKFEKDMSPRESNIQEESTKENSPPFFEHPDDPRAGADGFDSDYSEIERDQEQGIEGADEENKHHKPRKIPSCRCFYATRLFERDGENQWSPILYARRLLEQYIVMSWLKVENTRLDYYRFHQSRLRCISKQGAMDQVEGDHLEFNAAPDDSERVILPPSYTYGPRYLRRNYLNAVELAIKKGPPHYFLTITCNLFWREIQENLHKKGDYGPAETAYDRPDLVVRVFKLKLDYLMQRLRDGALGTFIWGSYRVEFQQRGLPHAHIVFRVAQPYAPKTPAIIDRIINAYSPDPRTHPNLFNKVKQYMMHPKCGETSTCWNHSKK
jgi:hypothetical protein